MFDRLSERLQVTFKKFSGGTVVNEAHVQEAFKEIRRSLLEADVHFKVARDLCDRLVQKAVGQKIWQSLTPSQQVVQIFQDELVQLLGGKEQQLPTFAAKPPLVVLIAGLQGSGKTTFCAKLALHLKKKLKKSVGLIPADCHRPAAKDQLTVLAKRVAVEIFDSPLSLGAKTVVTQGLAWAQHQQLDVVIIDTAGRQQIDEALMDELKVVADISQPHEKFLVVDAMIGSQGLEVSRAFHEKIQLTGLVLSKLDGDARGGVALSAREVTGVPIYFASVGEKPEDLEPFHPERMASRILGMGDVLTLIEKAKETISEDEAMTSANKMMKGQFSLEDFRDHLKKLQSMGPLEGILKLLPGMGSMMEQIKAQNPEKEMKKVEAIINSMTPYERRNHTVLNGSRKERIAKGSGTSPAEINRFLKQFTETQKMMKMFSGMGFGGKARGLAKMIKPK